jgi:formate hydrogenlyase transcriptional activator
MSRTENVIGKSAKFVAALRQVQIAAPAECAVLLQGETGTGKEVFAQAIHEQSRRRALPLVRVNCAAIPSGLLESELFGHEKGAYTGASTERSGRFQLADRGTLFLDEIGDLPLELQPKLLRVLQEGEFERLGSARTIRVDVRIVAATHRNLSQMVNEGKFRADLYYRLNVFPITVPPLRDRPEDIPALVCHFVKIFAAQVNKQIDHIPEEVLDILQSHDWPGNIRELQNFIERSVLLSPGFILNAPVADLRQSTYPRLAVPVRPLVELERSCIVETLQRTNWVVGGASGAAAQLGLPRTTLLYKMRKFGISREIGGTSVPSGLVAYA